jgi:type II secretory pathway pseudopilin PulG
MHSEVDRHHGRRSLRVVRGGFTLIEMLIVISVIIVLLGLLIVALNYATKASQKANTQSLMISIRQGLTRFKEDIGYNPPVLDLERRPFHLFDNGVDLQTWYSYTTLAEYMIGYGHHYEDGWGVVPDAGDTNKDWFEIRNTDSSESPATGIRHPGFDGVWGATRYSGSLAERMRGADGSQGSESAPWPIDEGKVYGPYIETKTRDLLGSTDGTFDPITDRLNVYFPGEANYNEDDPKVLADYWGNPIRYYRRVYAIGALDTPYRTFDPNNPAPTLADVFVLRPYDVSGYASVTGLPDASTVIPGGDPTTISSLRSAEFALFSPGPDRAFDRDIRRDPDQLNVDNIVEVAP